jgi:adenylosuccinate synthase
MRQFESLLHRGIKVAAVVCGQWGDTGKGKIVDRLVTEWADVIIRGTGGANAGHTVRVGDLQFILHLIPSGILHDGNGKINIIGNGVAFEPRQACEELDELHEHGVEANNLAIAHNAKLILPQHILMDMIRESGQGSGKIGTTGRGIGPCYTDHYARIGLTVNDTLNPDVLVKKLERNLRDKLVILNRFDPEEVKRAMQHPRLDTTHQSVFSISLQLSIDTSSTASVSRATLGIPNNTLVSCTQKENVSFSKELRAPYCPVISGHIPS